MDNIVKILSAEPVTHNVRSYKVERPAGYSFNPGQATEVSINKPGWEEEKRPFTFTCLQDAPYLEFIIKSYSDHDGMTNELNKLKAGDELIIRDVWGAIEYKGPGYFIAGGAGITPFIAILRDLDKKNNAAGNTLFFSNRTPNDIILKDELESILGDHVINIVTEAPGNGYYSGRIDEVFLKEHVTDFSKHFYVCGPDPMIKTINETLERLGASPENVVFEK